MLPEGPAPSGLTALIDSWNDTGALKNDAIDYLARVDAGLKAAFTPLIQIKPLLHGRSQAIDTVMGKLWHAFMPDAPNAALLAVGGYGRGELYPASDIDLLILLEAQPSEDFCSAISELITMAWDIGLQVGHSVRTLEECESLAREDLTIITTMMEARTITGNPELAPQLAALIASGNMWPSDQFFAAKLDEQRARHTKYANSEYRLEPNVKTSPGGLRDIQLIGWVAHRHYGSAIEHLSDEAFLNDAEQEMLDNGRNFIGQVRFALHVLSGRDENRLLFDFQRKLAAEWGFEDGDKLAVEQFMQVYYRWAQSLSQLNDHLMQIFERSILVTEESSQCTTLDDDFEVCGGHLTALNEQVFERSPSNLLRAFVLLATHEDIIRLDAETQRLLRDSTHLIDDRFREDPENRALFMQLLESPYGLTRHLRTMARNDVLGRYLPEFGKVIGQMQFDLFHTYTVDAHTLEVLAYTRRFFRADFTDKFPVSTRIAQRLRRPALLYIAALYHDIGKGRGGDHSELGAVDARDFCERHSINEHDSELIVWLVKNHLLMSSVAQRKDISDPEEIQRFAEFCGSGERLDYLYTLTVADINGTNPELWNAWRGSLLRQLYTETRRALDRGLSNPLGRSQVIEQTKREAAKLLEYRGFFGDDLEAIWERRGEDYFLRERAEDIAWHTEAIADHEHIEAPLVLVRHPLDSPVANTTQIFVHAQDKPELLVRICIELELLYLSIHDARIYTGTDGATLNTFYVLNSDGSPIASDEENLDHIRRSIETGLASNKSRSSTRRTPRQLKSFVMPTETNIRQDLDRGWTILEVATPDRPGLLARLSALFIDHGVALQSAKIQTLGERVEDVFFVTDMQGRALTNNTMLEQLQTAIRETLDGEMQQQ